MVKILESDNKDYGCYGNLMICFNGDINKVNEKWNVIFKAIYDMTKLPPKSIRDLLDSGFGRHFVDEFYSVLVNNQEFRTEFKKKFTKQKVLKLFNRYVEEED